MPDVTKNPEGIRLERHAVRRQFKEPVTGKVRRQGEIYEVIEGTPAHNFVVTYELYFQLLEYKTLPMEFNPLTTEQLIKS